MGEKYSREMVLDFMKNNLPGEGITFPEIYDRWSRNEFTEEEIRWFEEFLEKQGVKERAYDHIWDMYYDEFDDYIPENS